MNKRQVDMETLRRDCKRELDSEFGGGRVGDCPQYGAYVNASLASYGGVQSSGARFGRGPSRNVWTTFV